MRNVVEDLREEEGVGGEEREGDRELTVCGSKGGGVDREDDAEEDEEANTEAELVKCVVGGFFWGKSWFGARGDGCGEAGEGCVGGWWW